MEDRYALNQRLGERAVHALSMARFVLFERGGTIIGPEHMLVGVLRTEPSLLRLLSPGGSLSVIESRLGLSASGTVSGSTEIPFSDAAKNAIGHAVEEADVLGDSELTPRHLLLGLLNDQRIAELLSDVGITKEIVVGRT